MPPHASASWTGGRAAPRLRRGCRLGVLLGSVVVALLAGGWPAAMASAPPSAASTPASMRGVAWGSDMFGQFGRRSTGTFPFPVGVTLPRGTSGLALGLDFTVALVGTSVRTWGANREGQLGDGTRVGRVAPVTLDLPPVRAVAAADRHTVAVTESGQVYAWGDNRAGQLGDGTRTGRYRPVRVPLPDGERAVAVGTGATDTLVVTGDGSVYAWGDNAYGQLGDRSTTASDTPVRVALPAGVKVVAVSVGARHCLALTSEGTVLAWGANDHGQLGIGPGGDSTVPTRVDVGTRVAAVVAGTRSSEALGTDGTVRAWGGNGEGQLGVGTTTDHDTPVTTHLPSGFDAGLLSGDGDQSLAVSKDGDTVVTWGAGSYGQLGNGTLTSSLTPATVSWSRDVAPAHVIAAAAGSTFDLLVTGSAPAPASSTGTVLTIALAVLAAVAIAAVLALIAWRRRGAGPPSAATARPALGDPAPVTGTTTHPTGEDGS